MDFEEGFDVALTGAMENACSLLPVDVAGCKNYIDVYGNMIGKYLGQDVSAADACSAMALC